MSHYVHDLNPILLSIGPIHIYWYGMMYVIGILLSWGALSWRCKAYHNGTYQGWNTGFQQRHIDDLIFYSALSLLIGGRLGSFLFYHPQALLENPLSFFNIQAGGMSFHGGLLGVIIGLAIYSYRQRIHWRDIADVGASVAPLGLLFGRIGNFINGELWGKPSDVPWAIVFPSGGNLPRHPSMLYEGALEGLVLFLIIWFVSRKPYRRGLPFGIFLLGYGAFRFMIEFIRVPDAHLGYIAWGWLTKGQQLCIPMMIIGLVLMLTASRVASSDKKLLLTEQDSSSTNTTKAVS